MQVIASQSNRVVIASQTSTGRKYVLARDQSFVTLSGKDPAQMKVLMSLANRAMLVLFGVFFFWIQFYVPFKLFHSYRDESIIRWDETRHTRGKTT